MNHKWSVKLELWPYGGFTQREVGPREITVTVGGANMAEAYASAELFVSGVLTNTRVWKAPIMSITAIRDLGTDARVGEWTGLSSSPKDGVTPSSSSNREEPAEVGKL